MNRSVLLLAATAACLASCDRGREETVPPPAEIETPDEPSPPITAGPRFEAAARAALGGMGPVEATIDGEQMMRAPYALVETGFAPVFLTAATNMSDCHACTGAMGIAYLKEADDGSFAVIRTWPAAIRGAGWGAPPELDGIDAQLATNPVLRFPGGYTGQGQTETWLQLVELTPDGPVISDPIPMGSSNAGMVGEDSKDLDETRGEIVDIATDEGFTVRFSGTRKEATRYTRQNGKFVAVK